MSVTDATIGEELDQGKTDWLKLWVPPFFKHLCVYDSHKKSREERKRRRKYRGKKEKGKKESDC